MKTILNTIIVAAIVLLLYSIVGHDFVKFYLGGQAEMLETAANINKLCNDVDACPTQMEGWQWVTAMHGRFRIPDLIKKADRICRA